MNSFTNKMKSVAPKNIFIKPRMKMQDLESIINGTLYDLASIETNNFYGTVALPEDLDKICMSIKSLFDNVWITLGMYKKQLVELVQIVNMQQGWENEFIEDIADAKTTNLFDKKVYHKENLFNRQVSNILNLMATSNSHYVNHPNKHLLLMKNLKYFDKLSTLYKQKNYKTRLIFVKGKPTLELYFAYSRIKTKKIDMLLKNLIDFLRIIDNKYETITTNYQKIKETELKYSGFVPSLLIITLPVFSKIDTHCEIKTKFNYNQYDDDVTHFRNYECCISGIDTSSSYKMAFVVLADTQTICDDVTYCDKLFRIDLEIPLDEINPDFVYPEMKSKIVVKFVKEYDTNKVENFLKKYQEIPDFRQTDNPDIIALLRSNVTLVFNQLLLRHKNKQMSTHNVVDALVSIVDDCGCLENIEYLDVLQLFKNTPECDYLYIFNKLLNKLKSVSAATILFSSYKEKYSKVLEWLVKKAFATNQFKQTITNNIINRLLLQSDTIMIKKGYQMIKYVIVITGGDIILNDPRLCDAFLLATSNNLLSEDLISTVVNYHDNLTKISSYYNKNLGSPSIKSMEISQLIGDLKKYKN